MALLDDFRRARRHGSRRRLLRAASWCGWSSGRLIEFLPIIKGKRRAFPERIDPREKKRLFILNRLIFRRRFFLKGKRRISGGEPGVRLFFCPKSRRKPKKGAKNAFLSFLIFHIYVYERTNARRRDERPAEGREKRVFIWFVIFHICI